MDRKKPDFRDRARRFPIEAPMTFRPVGEQEWLGGLTRNISRTGLLFRAPKTLDSATPIEIRLELPVAGPALPPARVSCRAKVVRQESETGDPEGCRLAATIQRFSFVRERTATNGNH